MIMKYFRGIFAFSWYILFVTFSVSMCLYRTKYILTHHNKKRFVGNNYQSIRLRSIVHVVGGGSLLDGSMEVCDDAK